MHTIYHWYSMGYSTHVYPLGYMGTMLSMYGTYHYGGYGYTGVYGYPTHYGYCVWYRY
jgi:hypothetical protein